MFWIGLIVGLIAASVIWILVIAITFGKMFEY